MKIDKSRPAHWLYLALFAVNVVMAIVWRRIRRPGQLRGRCVVLYGHKLNGNLLALYEYLRKHESDIEVVFLTMDPAYHRALESKGTASVLALSPACARLLGRARAIISDHGLHVMKWLLGRRDIRFFDVWHGIPFKGFDADDFRLQHCYDETWVASELLARMYVSRFGFRPGRVRATGYARTDRLVERTEDVDALKRRFGLDGEDVGRIVLFAPTWKQDSQKRSLYPFGLGEEEFFATLSGVARRHRATFVMRAHLNSGESPRTSMDRIVFRSHGAWPDTEGLLLVSDILVCDWSSIAFDYLLLNRPAVFLDVPAPFAKGFSLGPEYRFGDIVPDMQALTHALDRYLGSPQTWQQEFASTARSIRQQVYGDRADGQSSRRCVERLRSAIDSA